MIVCSSKNIKASAEYLAHTLFTGFIIIRGIKNMQNDNTNASVSPVNDADHAVLTVVGAVDAQLVQQVQQQHAEVAVELADGGLQSIRMDGVHVLSQQLKQ